MRWEQPTACSQVQLRGEGGGSGASPREQVPQQERARTAPGGEPDQAWGLRTGRARGPSSGGPQPPL